MFLSHFSVTSLILSRSHGIVHENQVFNSLFDFYLLEMLLLLKQAFIDVYINNFLLSGSEAVRNLNVTVLNESALQVTWDKPHETNGVLLGYGLNVSHGSGCVQKIYLNNSTNCETPVSTTHSYTQYKCMTRSLSDERVKVGSRRFTKGEKKKRKDKVKAELNPLTR